MVLPAVELRPEPHIPLLSAVLIISSHTQPALPSSCALPSVPSSTLLSFPDRQMQFVWQWQRQEDCLSFLSLKDEKMNKGLERGLSS